MCNGKKKKIIIPISNAVKLVYVLLNPYLKCHLSSVFTTLILWRERNKNDRTFNNITHVVYHCVYNSYLNIHYWTTQVFDRERMCISEDDDNYMQHISLIAEDHKKGNADWEE